MTEQIRNSIRVEGGYAVLTMDYTWIVKHEDGEQAGTFRAATTTTMKGVASNGTTHERYYQAYPRESAMIAVTDLAEAMIRETR